MPTCNYVIDPSAGEICGAPVVISESRCIKNHSFDPHSAQTNRPVNQDALPRTAPPPDDDESTLNPPLEAERAHGQPALDIDLIGYVLAEEDGPALSASSQPIDGTDVDALLRSYVGDKHPSPHTIPPPQGERRDRGVHVSPLRPPSLKPPRSGT